MFSALLFRERVIRTSACMFPRRCAVVLALSLIAASAARVSAQSPGFTDGLMSGDYLRISAGEISSVRPQGSQKYWDRGPTANVMWESWYGASATDPGLFAFGFGGSFGHLRLNTSRFLADFTTIEGDSAVSATASNATVFSLETNVRMRIPAPFIMPSISLGVGYLDFQPGHVHYNTATDTGTTTQQRRRGAQFTAGAAVDKHIVQRFAIFGEALYTYGLTALSQGGFTIGSGCLSRGCDALKNTAFGTVRAGLRLQIGK